MEISTAKTVNEGSGNGFRSGKTWYGDGGKINLGGMEFGGLEKMGENVEERKYDEEKMFKL